MRCTSLLPERPLWSHPRPWLSHHLDPLLLTPSPPAVLFSSLAFLKRLLSSPCLLLLSLGLSLLLASVSVMGYQSEWHMVGKKEK